MLVFFMAILSILQSNVIFYGHLVHFVVIWYIIPILVYCTEKNLATLLNGHRAHLKNRRSLGYFPVFIGRDLKTPPSTSRRVTR
jgi:hypothetical protein